MLGEVEASSFSVAVAESAARGIPHAKAPWSSASGTPGPTHSASAGTAVAVGVLASTVGTGIAVGWLAQATEEAARARSSRALFTGV